ncbi:MAG: hypothetical protein ACRDYV_00020 [Acidimicrobiia bacterium]
MWHASVASSGLALGAALRLRIAGEWLAGVGDPELGQWHEEGENAVHLRRRLAAAEAARVGPVRDVRGTPEARYRARKLGRRLTYVPATVLEAECGTADLT